MYEGNRVFVKVTGAKWSKIPITAGKTSIGDNSGSIKHRAVKFACNTGFLPMADQMV